MKILLVALTLLLAILPPISHSQSADPLTFSVSPGQVTEVSVVPTADGTRLRMNLVSDKRIEFADFTQRNFDKKVRIVVADKLVGEPVIKGHITNGCFEVIASSPEEGFTIAKALVAAKASSDQKATDQNQGVDLLTADYTRDAHGNLLIVLPDKTPFDADAAARKRYLDAYAEGFHSGYTGRLVDHETTSQPLLPGQVEGWSAGQWTGYRAYRNEDFHIRP